MLELRGVTKIYNPGSITEHRLFDRFSLTVEEGQFVSIVGSNGSGKTSLLNIICGSIPIEAGDVLVGGKSIARLRDYRRYAVMGRVYQNPAAGTCPNLTMLENLSLADNKGRRFGLGAAVDRRRMDAYREQLSSLGLGLEDKLDVKMGALSGGQRQAVSLLMATMTPLRFLILDEHTAALDPKTAEIIMTLTDKVVQGKASDRHDGDPQPPPRRAIRRPHPDDEPGPGGPGPLRGRKAAHLHGGSAHHVQSNFNAMRLTEKAFSTSCCKFFKLRKV